ncbi:MAG: DUF1566 domain-containing protein, partial [Magnetococcales bacterium]|nr:DUF1566 domain-containing protein [Magnetococcales bacterium]
MKRFLLPFATPLFLAATGWAAVVVGTGQDRCYDTVAEIPCPSVGEPFFGQDANYPGKSPSYRDNNDGTVLDLNTGLLWTKGVDPVKVSLVEAEAIAKTMQLAGHGDWRVRHWARTIPKKTRIQRNQQVAAGREKS